MRSYENAEPTNSLPRFNSKLVFSSSSCSMKLNSNQSADIDKNTFKPTNHTHTNNIKIQEYSEKNTKCLRNFDSINDKLNLQYIYGILCNSLESHARYRKLKNCKALSNFLEYRNTIFKREKIRDENILKADTSRKIVQFSPSITSENALTMQNSSPIKLKESLIPIPSPELLKVPFGSTHHSPLKSRKEIHKSTKNIKLKQK